MGFLGERCHSDQVADAIPGISGFAPLILKRMQSSAGVNRV